MDREPSVIRAEMSQTRAGMERKIALLRERARDLAPGRLAERHLPEHAADRALGAALTLVGLRMAWTVWRRRGRGRTAAPTTVPRGRG